MKNKFYIKIGNYLFNIISFDIMYVFLDRERE